MRFIFTQKVLFKHCDPAGIVFYPRYFEMMNDCVESFFDKEMNHPFEKLLQNGGMPTAQISTSFLAPSRHGDVLKLEWSIIKLGCSSLTYEICAKCKSETRFETSCTLVNVNNEGKPTSWPEQMRDKFISFMEGR